MADEKRSITRKEARAIRMDLQLKKLAAALKITDPSDPRYAVIVARYDEMVVESMVGMAEAAIEQVKSAHSRKKLGVNIEVPTLVISLQTTEPQTGKNN